MEDKLRLNTSFWGFDGIIGRRDFFLNIVYVCIISTLLTMPYLIWCTLNIESFLEALNCSSVFYKAPILLKIWHILSTITVVALYLSNVTRRLNDICGEINKVINGIVYGIAILANFAFLIFPYLSFLFIFINLAINLILLFYPGKITSRYPYDFRKEFNWGAFLGTWVWGLFNKTYVTLWQLILAWTPFGFYWKLICGLKGNEWAYRNKKADNIDEFNKSQEKQATVFAVLVALVGPILYLGFVFAIVGLLTFGIMKDVKDNPEAAKSRMETIENGLESFTSSFYEKYEITDKENKYYVLNSDWKGYDFKTKKDMLDMFASKSANIRRKEYRIKNEGKDAEFVYFSKTDELPRTKIYSVESGELLGEFVFDDSVLEKSSFVETLKSALNSYRFYNPKG